MTGERRSRSTEAFFGRRRGKTLRPLPTVALAKGLDTYGLDISRPAQMELSELFDGGVSRIRLEIGFGGGEHLHHAASADPSTGFLGVEPFVNGMAKAMQLLSVRPLPNIRVYDDDATRLLDWLPDNSLAGIDLFYPDPWPKKKHWKRRFVSPANLGRFTRVMKTGALFRFASDIDNYVNWTLLHVRSSGAFDWLASEADDWHRPFEDWPGTRYEAKAIREGRRPAYLTFRRR